MDSLLHLGALWNVSATDGSNAPLLSLRLRYGNEKHHLWQFSQNASNSVEHVFHYPFVSKLFLCLVRRKHTDGVRGLNYP